MRYSKLLIVAITILVMLVPGLVHARWSVVPRLSLEAGYDDNLFLQESDEQDDFVTTVSPGIAVTYETPTDVFDLDYEFRQFLYTDFSELDFTEHRGRLNARKDFGARWTVGIRDYFVSSEDPIELTGIAEFERAEVRLRDRNRYTRNILEPDLAYRFGEDRSLRVGYRNNLLRNDSERIADLDENALNGLLTYRFTIHSTVEGFYERAVLDYGSIVPSSPPKDNKQDRVRLRYSYGFNPRTSGFFEYRFRRYDFDVESQVFFDYDVHTPSIGVSRAFRENVSLLAQLGYDYRDPDVGSREGQPYGLARFNGQYDRLTLSVYGEGGLGESLTGTENLGFNEFWRIGVDGTYQLAERFWADGFLYYRNEDFSDVDRLDKSWSVRGRLRYGVFRWLFVSLDYSYFSRDSSALFQSFTDNRVFGRLTAQYDIAERYQ